MPSVYSPSVCYRCCSRSAVDSSFGPSCEKWHLLLVFDPLQGIKSLIQSLISGASINSDRKLVCEHINRRLFFARPCWMVVGRRKWNRLFFFFLCFNSIFYFIDFQSYLYCFFFHFGTLICYSFSKFLGWKIRS